MAETSSTSLKAGYERGEALAEIAVLRAKSGDPAGALRLSDGDGRAAAWVSMLYAKAGDSQKALEVARAIKAEDWRCAAILTLVSWMDRSGGPGDGQKLLESDQGVRSAIAKLSNQGPGRSSGWNAEALGYLARKAAAKGLVDPDSMFSIYSMASNLHEFNDYGVTAGTMAMAGDRKGADIWMSYFLSQQKEEQANGSENTAGTVGVARGLMYAGDFEDAMRLAAASKDEDAQFSIYLSATLYYADSGDLANAQASLGKLTTKPYRAVGLALIAKAMADAHDSRALETAKSAIEVRAELRDPQYRIWTTVMLVETFVSLNDRKRAAEELTRLDALTHEQRSGDTEEELVRLSLLVGNLEMAQKWGKGSERLLASITAFQLKSGDLKGAAQTSRQMHNLIENDKLPIGSFVQKALQTEAQFADEKGLESWALNLKNPVSKTYALIGIAEGVLLRRDGGLVPLRLFFVKVDAQRGSSQKIERVKDLVTEAAKAAGELGNDEGVSELWGGIRLLFAKVGDFSAAAKGGDIGHEQMFYVGAEIIKQQIAAGQLEAALETVDKFDLSNWGHEQVALAHLTSGDAQGAASVILRLQPGDSSADQMVARSLGKVAEACNLKGEAAAARQIWNKAADLIERQEFQTTRDDIAGIVASSFAQGHDFASAIRIAEQIKGDSSRNVAYLDIIENQAATGDSKAAMSTLDRLSVPSRRQWGLERIAAAQARRGDWEDALKTFEIVKREADPNEDSSFDSIAVAFAEAGRFDLARQIAVAAPGVAGRAEALLQVARWQTNKDAKGTMETLALVAEVIRAGDYDRRPMDVWRLAQVAVRIRDPKSEEYLRTAAEADMTSEKSLQSPTITIEACIELLRFGALSSAEQFASKVKSPADQCAIQIAIGRYYLVRQERELARAALHKALEASRKPVSGNGIGRSSSDGPGEELAALFVAAGERAEADKILATSKPPSSQSLDILHAIACGLAANGDLLEAKALIAKIPETDYRRRDTVHDVALITVKRFGEERAIGWARSLASDRNRAIALVAIGTWILDPAMGPFIDPTELPANVELEGE